MVLACGGGDAAPSRYPASSTLAARCAAPRAASGDAQGSVGDEKAWVRSWMDELYLWYREVPEVDPAGFSTPGDYFAALRTPAVTPSGHPKDRFHFTYPTAEWTALIQTGIDLGYGLQWALRSPTVPRDVVVAYDEPDTPAASQGIGRGARLILADGVDVVNTTDPGEVAAINAALFPSAEGETHSFVFEDLSGATFPATLVAGTYASAPVQNVRTIDPGDGQGRVGYLLFNDHVATAEAALVDAISALQAAGVSDLVLDLRYNGGGYVDLASEVAFMIAGPAATAGKTFEQTVFNDKYAGKDPVTGQPLASLGFESTTRGFSLAPGQALPTLALPRVFVLTGSGTCSASESIINGLQGVDLRVVQIGSPTCGKPYGFYPRDNCGTTYFAIQFAGVNAKGFGSYADGFTPGGTGDASPPGCAVADDFTHALGDREEARLAAALHYRATGGACPGAAPAVSARARVLRRPAADAVVPKSPLRTNRILRM